MPSKENVNPDLLKERRNCDFNVGELAAWWNGGDKKLAEKRVLENLFYDDPEFQNEMRAPDMFLSKKEFYERSLQRTTSIVMKLRKIQAETNDEFIKNIKLDELFRRDFIGSNPIATNYVMFVPTIIGQGTQEQKDEWLDRALKCNIIGTYAQTELGHGSFIRGLETRADYDPKSQEFILNSPTITSYKWWPGGLAHSSNYAVVLAQLFSQGKCHGLQSFIVQLRDEETHMPLSGIDIGNIGSKLGMNVVDNGYLGFKNVRVPRKNMLMKNSQILEDGTFIKSPSSVLTYGTMTFVRVAIVRLVNNLLTRAVTIATRYSAVRRQSPIDVNQPEPQVIDHVTQQLKLFPHIAKTFVFKLTGDYLWAMHDVIIAELQNGNITRLPEMHALSCCLKAVCSADASKGIEVLRMACGGHGYLDSSNLPNLYGLTVPACTYEGENTVVLLQTARFLIKSWSKVLKGEKLTPTVAYLREAKEKSMKNWDKSIPGIIKAFQFAAANKVRIAFENLEEKINLGNSREEALNLTGIEMTQAAELHGRGFLLSSGFTELLKATGKMSIKLATVLRQLFELYVVDAALNSLGDLSRFVKITENDIKDLEVRLINVLQAIRPNAVGIVDGYDIHDGVLSSTLGAYDGNVYERMFAEAKRDPFNQEPVNKSFHLYLKPFMNSRL